MRRILNAIKTQKIHSQEHYRIGSFAISYKLRGAFAVLTASIG